MCQLKWENTLTSTLRIFFILFRVNYLLQYELSVPETARKIS